MSDCDAVDDIVTGHKYTKTEAEAAALALKPGLDTDCSIGDMLGGDSVRTRYTEAYQQGLISEKDIDQALVRVFTARFELGVGDAGQPRARLRRLPIDHALARRAAQESLVLLKNDGVLPLEGVRRIAVIGPLADSERALYANYNAGITDRIVSVVAGLRDAFPKAEIAAPPGAQIPGDGSTIPATALRSEDGRPGLSYRLYVAKDPPRRVGTAAERMAALFSTKFPTQPARSEVRPTVNEVRFGGRDPQSVERQTWTGFVVPEESGLYRIGLRSSLAQISFAGEELKGTPSDIGGVFARAFAGRRTGMAAGSIGGGAGSYASWSRR